MKDRIVDRLRRSSGPRLGAAAVILVGLVWLFVDVATDGDPALDGDVHERIDAYVQDQLDGSRIPGAAVAIVEDGATVHAVGYGDDGRGNAVRADTPFWIGSNTKSITALAVMQLVEDGLVDLDQPIQRYLPDFRVADDEASSQITVRHLLNQTSGIARIDDLKVIAAAEDQTMHATIDDMADLELNRPVGESFEYANLNSVVLGVLIEELTGEPWEAYVQANIFDPLDMAHTYTDQDVAEADGLTATHRSFFGFPVETSAAHLDSVAATGYVYSTAEDVARYLTMYLEGGASNGQQILSTEGITEMLSPATDPRTFPLQSQSFTASYGAGWFVGPFGVADDARWHQGSLPHFTAWMVLLPDTDQGIVVLLNEGNQFEIAGANATWSRIPQGIVALLRGEEPPTGPGAARFFIIFTTLTLAIVVAQAWTLARLARHGLRQDIPPWRTKAPLAWELGLAVVVLALFPAITGGLGWTTTFAFVPDLTLTVSVIAGLAVITGLVRVVRLIQRRRSAPSDPDRPTSQPEDADTKELLLSTAARR